MTFYKLTHIDDRLLPVRLTVNSIDFLVTDGSLQFEPPNESRAFPGADGMLHWDMRGFRLPAADLDRVMADREFYRRVSPDQVEFPVYHDDRPAEYVVTLRGEALLMRTLAGDASSAQRVFGGDRSWQFTAAPNPG
jgi:hypothetical protein